MSVLYFSLSCFVYHKNILRIDVLLLGELSHHDLPGDLHESYPLHSCILMNTRVLSSQGTFGREPQAKPEDDRYLRAAIQEYDNIAKLGQIMREGPIKVRHMHVTLSRITHPMS